jgi:glycosyltransferase involved in cell wall biosynthesis
MSRILILTNRIPYPLKDGGALAMDAMIRGYHEAGWQVHLLAMNTSRHPVPPQTLATLYNELAGFYTVDVDNTVSKTAVLRNYFLSRQPEHVERFSSPAFAARLREVLEGVKPEVVQLESPFLAGYLPTIKEASKAKVVYRMHNVEAEIWMRLATESRGLKRMYLKNLARRISKYEQTLWSDADLLLPITTTDGDAVKAASISTPQVVSPFGIEVPAENSKLPPYPLKAYHIGAMDWLPNEEGIRWFLSEVWPKLHEWAPEVTFHFAGRGMPDYFKKDLPEGVYCEGEVADAQAFIADKHVLVVPIRSGSGIRVKILEAMAAGKLVISTEVGMQGIEARSEMHYLSATSAHDFAHLIGWASSHRDKVVSFTEFAQMLTREQYDARDIMRRIVDALASMIGG